MFGYTLEEVTSNGIPVLAAATIKTITAGVIDIKGKDLDFLPHYTYEPDYLKELDSDLYIRSAENQIDWNHSCMAYPIKKLIN